MLNGDNNKEVVAAEDMEEKLNKLLHKRTELVDQVHTLMAKIRMCEGRIAEVRDAIKLVSLKLLVFATIVMCTESPHELLGIISTAVRRRYLCL